MSPEGNSPAISVVLPVYNGLPYLELAVKSVLQQTFRDFELLAIDDGSTDESRDLLHRLAASDPRIRVLNIPKSGMRTAVNHGLSEARAEIVARMDQDDICLPNRFAKQYDFLQSEPEVVAVGGGAWAMDDAGVAMFPILCPTDWENIKARLLSGSNTFIHPAMMYRKTTVLEVGAYQDEYPTDEYGLWLRLAEVGRLSNLPDIVLNYRMYASDRSIQKHQQQRESVKRILIEAYHRRGLDTVPDLPPDHSPGTVARIHHHWAMSAVSCGNWAAARKHAKAAVTQDPSSLHAWWTMIKSTMRIKRGPKQWLEHFSRHHDKM